MANVIKLKRGTSTPTTSNIVDGEVAVDTSAKKLYVNDGGTVKEIGGSSGVADGSITTAKLADDAVTNSKIASGAITNTELSGDIAANKLEVNDAHIIIGDASADGALQTLSGDVSMTRTGATTIADDAVTYAKIQNVSATDRVLGRDSSGAGVIEEITPANLRTMINVADGANVGITDVVSDTTPQLGGDLDMNSKFISSGILGIKNQGLQSELRLYCESNNAHYASIKAPAHANFPSGTNFTYTLPSGYGSNGQVLQSDGSGGTSWTALTDATKLPLTGGTLTGSVTFEDAINETVYTITGTSVTLNPDNGMIQTWTLSNTSTATDDLTDGQSMLLKVTAGGNSLTISPATGNPAVKWVGGSPPTLGTETAIELFRIGNQLYAATVGDLS